MGSPTRAREVFAQVNKPADALTHRRNQRLHFHLARAMFVVPNLFTLSSVFCGFWAMVQISGVAGPGQFHRAALAIYFSIFFDMADGRVARMTRTQSEFGMQLDSLADVVAFGVVPALVVYRWALFGLGFAGVLAAFLYIAAGALRLARFNVLAARGVSASRAHFVGLPIPLAAGVLASLVMLHQRMYAPVALRLVHVLALMLLLSALMVSNVRYRSFKDVGLSPGSILAFFGLMGLFAGLAVWVEPSFACLAFFSIYVALGLIEEALRLGRRLAPRQRG